MNQNSENTNVNDIASAALTAAPAEAKTLLQPRTKAILKKGFKWTVGVGTVLGAGAAAFYLIRRGGGNAVTAAVESVADVAKAAASLVKR